MVTIKKVYCIADDYIDLCIREITNFNSNNRMDIIYIHTKASKMSSKQNK